MNTTTQAKTANFDINSLLDGTIDDLADMPEFKPYPAGMHIVSATLVDKTEKRNWIGTHPAFELKLKAIQTEELADPQKDQPLEPGAETNIAYMLDNELGQGQFKKIMAVVSEKFGGQGKSVREMAAMVKDLNCVVITNVRSNKEKTQSYTNIVEFSIV